MNKQKWLWEFSKRLVVMCVVIYAIVQLYSMVVMTVSGEYSALPTLNEQITDVMKTCVFGYFVKAGAENVIREFRRKREDTHDDEY